MSAPQVPPAWPSPSCPPGDPPWAPQGTATPRADANVGAAAWPAIDKDGMQAMPAGFGLQPSPPTSSRILDSVTPSSAMSADVAPPPPGGLLRAKSEGVHSQESRRKSRKVEQEMQLEMARSLEAAAKRVEKLTSQMAQDREAGSLRDERILQAMEALACLQPHSAATKDNHDKENEVPEQEPAVMPHERAQREEPIYRPFIGRNGQRCELPEVEVSVKVHQICNVNTANLTFEADFVCQLDWSDRNVEGLSDEELAELDWGDYFNPYVDIDNCKENCGWIKGADEIPRRRRAGALRRLGGRSDLEIDGLSSQHRTSIGVSVGTGIELRKTMRYRGVLSITSVNLRCFPFDIQELSVRLKAARRRRFIKAADGPAFAAAVPRSEIDRVSLIHSNSMMREPAYQDADTRMRGQGHFAVPTAGEALLEFDICSITGCHPLTDRADVYDVTILVERPLVASYICDLLIMNLLVGLASCAFWDTAAPELSSRMSISLTVILTLAAYTSTRPAPIEKAPYVTFHDWCEQMCMLLVTGISLQNVVAVVTCGGAHPEAPAHMTAMFERHQEECSEGWCLSRKVDCQAVLVLLGSWIGLAIYSAFWLLRARHKTTRELRKRLLASQLQRGIHADDAEVEPEMSWSRSDSVDSSDSFGSWTYRCRQSKLRCSGYAWTFTTRSMRLIRWLCRCFCCRTSTVLQQGDDAPSRSSPRYIQASDSSPVSLPAQPRRSAAEGQRGPVRPCPLDMCASFGAGSTPTSPTGLQSRIRARTCPSTPIGNASIMGQAPASSPTSSTLSNCGQQPPLGRSLT